MKITIINGSMRHGSTWHCADLIMKELASIEETEITEFFLPRDMPHFCCGCFSCFYNGEDTCPHAESVQPIAEALLQADLIVLNSSVYGLDVTGQIKALLDHLCYQWISHRPNPRMFNKIALTVVTTAGGPSHATKTLRNSLRFWGVKRIYSFKSAVAATKWSEVTEKNQAKIKKETARLARRIAHDVKNAKKLPSPLILGILMKAMAGAMHKYENWNPRDLQHWESNNWFKGVNRL